MIIKVTIKDKIETMILKCLFLLGYKIIKQKY